MSARQKSNRQDAVGISRDHWLAALKEIESAPLPNSDALSTAEFAAMLGISRTQAVRRLALLLKAGRAEQTTKLIRRTGTGITTIPAFRLKP